MVEWVKVNYNTWYYFDPSLFEDKQMHTGKIIKLSSVEQGYGFIVSKEIPCERIYFHWSNLIQSTLRFPKLEKGMYVTFDARETPDKGMRAYRIKVVTDPTTEPKTDG